MGFLWKLEDGSSQTRCRPPTFRRSLTRPILKKTTPRRLRCLA